MRKLLIIYTAFLFIGCCFFAGDFLVQAKYEAPYQWAPSKEDAQPVTQAVSAATHSFIPREEQALVDAGLLNIQKLDSSIVVDLKYSTRDNFLLMDVYGDLNNAYLQKDVAQKLHNAQLLLKSKYPYYSLIVYDAVRPRNIQTKMWDSIGVPAFERSKYVSNPRNGSLHNFGAAVDISIVDDSGITLDMGTPYDFFGELAYPREEQRLLREGKLSNRQICNREILRDVMQQSGFTGITTEWWHFNSCSRTEAIIKYKIVE